MNENLLKEIVDWDRDVMFHSNPNMFIRSSYYLSIKENYSKDDIIKHLIFCIDRYPNMIITALHDLTGEIPFKKEDCGNILELCKAWKEWYTNHVTQMAPISSL